MHGCPQFRGFVSYVLEAVPQRRVTNPWLLRLSIPMLTDDRRNEQIVRNLCSKSVSEFKPQRIFLRPLPKVFLNGWPCFADGERKAGAPIWRFVVYHMDNQ